MICLDTNVVIGLLNDEASAAHTRFDEVAAAGAVVALSTVVLFELRYGAAKSARQDYNSQRIDAFLAGPFAIWPFDADDAREAGDIRAVLRKAGTPIGPYDVLIAAQARRRGALLITANTREFARVPSLRFEDWSG